MLLRCTSVGWAVSTGETALASVCEIVVGRNARPAQTRQGDLGCCPLCVSPHAHAMAAAADNGGLRPGCQVTEAGEGESRSLSGRRSGTSSSFLSARSASLVGIAAEKATELAGTCSTSSVRLHPFSRITSPKIRPSRRMSSISRLSLSDRFMREGLRDGKDVARGQRRTGHNRPHQLQMRAHA